MKHGQVTGFAIAAILLLIAALGIFWLVRINVPIGPDTPRPTLDIENCIETHALSQIQRIGLRGGFGDDVTIGSLQQRDTGTERSTFGAPPQIGAGLHVEHPDRIRHHNTYRLANFIHMPRFARGDFPTGQSLTTMIRNSVEDQCSDVSVASVVYSDTSTTIRTLIEEDGRSPYEVSISTPIPIQRYHDALRSVLTDANRNHGSNLQSSGEDYRIRAIGNINDNNDTLVVLETDRPLLPSGPFVYLTIVFNRPPVWIDDPSGKFSCDSDNPEADAQLENLIMDPDPDHTPELVDGSCIENGDTISFTITSGGTEYDVEVDA